MISNKSLCFVEWGKSPEQYFNASRKVKVSHYWPDPLLHAQRHLSPVMNICIAKEHPSHALSLGEKKIKIVRL